MKELEKNELMGVDGGYTKVPPWLKGSIWGAIAFVVIENWSDIKSGVVDGWTDAVNGN